MRDVPFRGKLRLLGAFVPRSGEKTARIFGYNVKLDLADDIHRWIYLGCYEPEETALLREHLKPGMNFLDVGANIGYFTLLAASIVGPSGRIFSVEPSPACSTRLAESVQANGIKNVRIERMGLSDQPGTSVLHIPRAEDRNHTPSMISWNEGESTSIEVPVRTLDAMIEEWGIDTIDVMKIDVEGYEPTIFRGASHALASGRIKAILCEFNAYYLEAAGSSTRDLYDTLINAGFYDVNPTSFREDAPLQTQFFKRSGDKAP
ncbi:FkbM family methyltransferase [Singulisphaera sp. PoT]|uniref:FkbM family methyltransferase n=1 Tax=Singulisphaera sp. PoT TaxID=3411797 RepID=UPI003BF48BC2